MEKLNDSTAKKILAIFFLLLFFATPASAQSVCSNLIIESSEQCDDGNLINEDGCSSACQLEAGFCINGWEKIFSGTGDVWSRSVVSVSDGFVIAGKSGAGNDDGWLVKTDLSGNKLWEKSFSEANNGYFESVVSVSDGFVMAGEIGYYAWLLKTDVSGNKLWETPLGSTGSEKFTDAISVPDGFVLAGISDGDGWLVKTDLSGNKVWEKSFSGTGDVWSRSVVSVSDGFVMAGYAFVGAGNDDGWLVKTDLSGNKLWEKYFGGVKRDHFNSVVSVSDGFVMAGYAFVGAGNDDGWLVKTDLSGNKLWEKYFGGMTYETFNSVDSVSDGFVMAGSTGADGWLVKTDLSGNKLWEKSFKVNGNYGYGGFFDATPVSDGFVLTGRSVFGTGVADGWLVKTDLSGNIVAPCCGNGQIDGSEECDDGNPNNADLCSAQCRKSYCGDGFVQSPNGRDGVSEQCDDGNIVGGDYDPVLGYACGSTCRIETGVFACVDTWAKTFFGDGGGIDVGWSVRQTFDSPNAVTQNSTGFIAVGTSYNSLTADDMFVVKTDNSGDSCSSGSDCSLSPLQFVSSFGGGFFQEARSVDQNFNSLGNPTGYTVLGTRYTGASNPDVNLFSIPPTGNTITWSARHGDFSTRSEKAYSLKPIGEPGNVTGDIIGADTFAFGVGPFGGNYFKDAWLLKTNSVGGIGCTYSSVDGNCYHAASSTFAKTFGSGNTDSLGGDFSVDVTSDGAVMVGNFAVSGTDSDLWVVKTDSLGASCKLGGEDCNPSTTQFANLLPDGTSNIAFGHSVWKTPDGGYIVGASTQGLGAVGKDLWLVKLDEFGTNCDYSGDGDCEGAIASKQFSRRFGGTGNEGVSGALIKTGDGGYLFA
ncbi:MAG: DUF4215 domain-containing protein, partial [archaeon]